MSDYVLLCTYSQVELENSCEQRIALETDKQIRSQTDRIRIQCVANADYRSDVYEYVSTRHNCQGNTKISNHVRAEQSVPSCVKITAFLTEVLSGFEYSVIQKQRMVTAFQLDLRDGQLSQKCFDLLHQLRSQFFENQQESSKQTD